jgi:hypothetical protein
MIHTIGPQPSFEKTLLRFDHVLDFDNWSKMERPDRSEIVDLTYFVGYVDLSRGSLGFL